MATILSFKTDQEIAQDLASWCAKQRLSQNLSQKDVYERAAIASSTYKKFEQTGETSLLRFIAILRAIGRIDVIEQILNTQPQISPMQRLTGNLWRTTYSGSHFSAWHSFTKRKWTTF